MSKSDGAWLETDRTLVRVADISMAVLLWETHHGDGDYDAEIRLTLRSGATAEFVATDPKMWPALKARLLEGA